ncbi:MAG TPA: hypothetical protein DCP63_11330 [Bacteroidetes bacterium]|nr:hypothetical protein [Bacteroidota bacterium]
MSRSTRKISTSLLLVAVFTLFNIGLPVVMYVCPMMEMNGPCCQSPTDGGAVSHVFSNQGGDCCASYIIAERNTNPFLSVNSYQAPHPEIMSFIGAPVAAEVFLGFSSVAFGDRSPPEPSTTAPLFLLNSALLI